MWYMLYDMLVEQTTMMSNGRIRHRSGILSRMVSTLDRIAQK
jgi:hypothetical protein